MSELPLVSIIVPVYNVKSYLDECLTSVLSQTFRNIEVVLIDDGSTDGSDALCDEWRERDSRVKVFHKPNGGLSDARNYGIDKARGKYLTFVDSDDCIAPDTVRYLMDLILGDGSEVSICDPVHVWEGSDWKYIQETSHKVFSGEEAVSEMLYQSSFLVSAWGKIYKRNLFIDIKFPKGKLFEDSATIYRVLERAKRVSYGNAQYYAYRHRKDSITTKQFDERDLDIWPIAKEISHHYENAAQGLRSSARSYQMSAALRIYLNAPRGLFASQVAECAAWIKENACEVLLDRHVRVKTKGAICLFLWMRPVMRVIYRRTPRWR